MPLANHGSFPGRIGRGHGATNPNRLDAPTSCFDDLPPRRIEDRRKPIDLSCPARAPRKPKTKEARIRRDDLGLDRLISDPTAVAQATRASEARWRAGRRRMVEPTTCERNYSAAELEFMQAMQEYKRSGGRLLPTWSEALEVLSALGYEEAEATAGPVGQSIVGGGGS